MRSKKLKILLPLLVAGAIGWVYKSYDRHREVRAFFRNSEDLVWAKKYLDNTINLCDSPWEKTIIVKSDVEDIYLSPSRRYEIRWNESSAEGALFLIADAKKDRLTKNSKILSRYFSAQWAKDERFLIFSPAITLDEWWIPLKIFISDAGTGKTIYFGKSEFYECEADDL